MIERITDETIAIDGEVIPYEEERDGDLPRNSDLIDDATLETTVDALQRQQAARERDQIIYDEMLEREADKLHGDYVRAIKHLHEIGYDDPSAADESFGPSATPAQLHTPVDDLALRALALKKESARERDALEH